MADSTSKPEIGADGPGFNGIEVPRNTTQWQEMLHLTVTEFNGNASRLMFVGARLRRALPRAKNLSLRAVVGQAELRIAAYRIDRHLRQAAASQTAASTALFKANEIMMGTFAPQRSENGRGRFDAAA